MTLTNDHGRGGARLGLGPAALLAAGDVAAFLVFAAVGRASHGEAAGLGAILQVAETAAPFIVGWLAVAPFADAFRAGITRQPGTMLRRSALAWLLAAPVGFILRALVRQQPIQPTFAAVTFVTVLLLLLGWRGVLAWALHRQSVRSLEIRD